MTSSQSPQVQLLFYMLVMSVSVLFREWSSASVFATSVVTVNLIGVAACLEHRSQQGGFFHRKGRIFLATLRIVATTVLVLGLEHARRAVGGDGHVTGPVAMGAKVYNQSVEAGNDAASVVIMVVTLVLFEFSCGLKASHLGLGRFYQKVDEETLSAGEDEALERGEHSRRLSKSSKSSVLSAGGAGAGGTSHRRSGSSKTSYPTTREEWLFDAYPSRLTTQRPSKTTTESHREDEGGPSSKRERSKDSSVSRGSSKDSAGGGEGATPWTLGLGAGYTRAGSPRYNYSSMTSSYNAGAPTCSIPPRSPRFSPRITPSPEKQHSLNYARQGYRNAHSHRSNERHCEDFNTPGGGRDREVERKAKKMTARFIFVDSNTPPLSKETPVNPWTTRSPRPQSKDTPLVNYGYSSGSDGKGKNTSSDDPGPSGPSGPPTPSEQEFGAGWGTEGPVGPTVGGGGLDMDAGGGGGGWAGDKYFYV